MIKSLRWVGLTAMAVLGPLTACGDDESNSGTASRPCERLARIMCDEARECAENPSVGGSNCRWFYSSGSTLGRNCPVCEGGLVDRFCNDPTKTAAMIDTCLAAMDGATCEKPVGDDPGVRIPSACDAVIPCGGGPCLN